MNPKKKKWMYRIWNILFFGFLAGILLSPTLKVWTMRLMMHTGLFDATIENTQNGKKATPFGFTDEAGKLHHSSDLQGKVVFINFWASWCPPCRAEMPSLNKLFLKFKDKDGLIFLFLNEDDNLEKAKAFLSKNGYQLPIASRNGEISSEIFKGSLPTTLIINKEGDIVYHHTGMADFSASSFETQLNSLIK